MATIRGSPSTPARINGLAAKFRAVLAGPMDVGIVTDFKQQIELFGEKRVVVFQAQPEEGICFYEGTATRNDFCAAVGNEVKGCEFLEDANRIGRAQHGNGAREPDVLRARCCGRKNHDRRRVEELCAMMLTDAKDIEPDLIGELNLLK